MRYDKYYLFLGIGIVLLFLSPFILVPQPQGDTISYIESVKYLRDGVHPEGFILNRLTTTFGALSVIVFASKIVGSILGPWFVMNAILFALAAFVFFKLLNLLFPDKKVALLGTLFLIGNYSILRFGLNFLMDMGGWAFYIFSLFFTLSYIQTQKRKEILLASLMVGVGGLFKEYAFLGVVPIAGILIYENRRSLFDIIKKSIAPALLALVPVILVYLWVYSKFGYTYADWFGANTTYYKYDSRIIEYIKSFGSLLHLLGLLFLGGLFVFYKKWSEIEIGKKVFIISVFLSFLPVFFWPAITQRLLFISVPFVVIITSFFVDKYKKYWYLLLVVFLVYLAINLIMDSVILGLINLPF